MAREKTGLSPYFPLDRLDPVTDGDDHVKVVELHRLVRAGNVQILHSAFLVQLALGEHIADVLGDYRALAAEQQAHLLLRKPDRFTIQPHFDTGVVAFVDDDF